MPQTPPRFEHQRHKPPTPLESERELVIVCPVLRSRVNLSRIVRAAGCFGVRRIIAARPFSVDREIARASLDYVEIESRGALIPVLEKLRQDGFHLAGLEQATGSQSLFEYRFHRRTALLLGHERDGIPPEELALLDDVAEIPVFGQPPSHNVAAAATIAIYEYCRQHSHALPAG
jgi:tRNA G18 (ribose-2'-O)-methylase SpoU